MFTKERKRKGSSKETRKGRSIEPEKHLTANKQEHE
jgi:hypothetical protein